MQRSSTDLIDIGDLAEPSEVPWSEMARMRDKLIHKYFGVDLDLTWDIVKGDLPNLKEEIERILEKVSRS